ncbi:hypothetical protein LC612_36855 [Nostoc sp. CHAB 5834]|nr:hypothetical protein [Nostoc sp. CHAB 5834]
MHGLNIFARTLSQPMKGENRFAFGNEWQYNSQSDRHSNCVLWPAFLDLLANCPLLQQHIREKKVGIGVNHPLLNPATGRQKNIGLVIARRTGDEPAIGKGPKTFAALGRHYGMVLSRTEARLLRSLPEVPLLTSSSLPILGGIDAKAAMTAHGKVYKSRLPDELNAVHTTVHSASEGAIAAGLVLVNASSTFISPVMNKHPLLPQPGGKSPVVSEHNQPTDALKVVSAMQNLPRASTYRGHGFDALGIGVISLANDGVSEVKLLNEPPYLSKDSVGFYQTFILEMAQKYVQRFNGI